MMETMTGCESILAVYNVNLKTRGHIGVMRKVLAQAKGFSQCQKRVHMICGDGPDIVRLVFEAGCETEREVITNGVIPGEFFVHVAEWISHSSVMLHSFRWAYVRYNPMHNNELLLLARSLCEIAVPMFVEMYTLEYINELPEMVAHRDKYYFRQLSPYVTGFFTPSRVSKGDSLLGRPLYKMSNGATFIKPSAPYVRKDIKESFHILGVGYLAKWHGYDRVLYSIPSFLAEYPGVDFKLYLVGEGPASKELKTIVEKMGMAERVSFTGALNENELANVYSGIHLAIGTLGFHRTGAHYAEPLKHREFMFYGLPFIYSCEDSFSYEPLHGVWRQPEDESDIDLIELYSRLLNDASLLPSHELRDYAVKNFTWSAQVNIIISTVDNVLRENNPAPKHFSC